MTTEIWWTNDSCSELFSIDVYASDFISFDWSKSYENELFLQESYLVKGKSPAHIAKEIGCSRHTINKQLKSLGILKQETKFDPKHASYSIGKRGVKGQSVDHLGERRIIEIMLRLRSEGLSYERIAQYLNDQGIPTKKGTGIWFAKVVRQILLRYDKTT